MSPAPPEPMPACPLALMPPWPGWSTTLDPHLLLYPFPPPPPSRLPPSLLPSSFIAATVPSASPSSRPSPHGLKSTACSASPSSPFSPSESSRGSSDPTNPSSTAAEPTTTPASNSRRLKPPRSDPRPASAPPRCHLPLRRRNRPGAARIVTAARFPSSSGRRRAAASPRQSPSSPTSTVFVEQPHGDGVSFLSFWTLSAPPSLPPSRHRRRSPPASRSQRNWPGPQPGPATRPADSGLCPTWHRPGPALRPAASATDPACKPAWADLWAGPHSKNSKIK